MLAGQKAPADLVEAFNSYPSRTDSAGFIQGSAQLQALCIADFEMARLKEMRDAKLLRFYISSEQKLAPFMMLFTGQALKLMVLLNKCCSW